MRALLLALLVLGTSPWAASAARSDPLSSSDQDALASAKRMLGPKLSASLAARVLKAIRGTGSSRSPWIPTDMEEWNYTLAQPRSPVEAEVAGGLPGGRFWTQ